LTYIICSVEKVIRDVCSASDWWYGQSRWRPVFYYVIWPCQ